MLQPRHRPDKENQVLRLPKTPGPGKSIVSKNPLKTPLNDENYSETTFRRTTVKKSVAFGQSVDTSTFNAFQTPGGPLTGFHADDVAPRRILGGKDLNTRQTPFHAPPPTIKPLNNAQGADAWSPPFTRPTHRRHSRKSSLGIRASPVKDVPVMEVDTEDIEYMPPTVQDIPFEPVDFDPIDWESFGAMRQDVVGYFVKTDEFGKSDMDYFVEQKMDFGKDEELPIAPGPPVKTVKSRKIASAAAGKAWAPTKPRTTTGRIPAKSQTTAPTKPFPKSTRANIPTSKPKMAKFVREDMVDEVASLEEEELALCKDDDFGMTFDLEL